MELVYFFGGGGLDGLGGTVFRGSLVALAGRLGLFDEKGRGGTGRGGGGRETWGDCPFLEMPQFVLAINVPSVEASNGCVSSVGTEPSDKSWVWLTVDGPLALCGCGCGSPGGVPDGRGKSSGVKGCSLGISSSKGFGRGLGGREGRVGGVGELLGVATFPASATGSVPFLFSEGDELSISTLPLDCTSLPPFPLPLSSLSEVSTRLGCGLGGRDGRVEGTGDSWELPRPVTSATAGCFPFSS